MKAAQQLFNFYLNSSIHVALTVCALTTLTFLEFEIKHDSTLLYFVFFATITGYNFVKYFGLAKFHHRSLASWLKAIQIFSFFSFIFMCYFAWQLPKKVLLTLSVFGIVTFFYAIPFLPKRFFIDKHHNLRSIGGLKVYVIGLIWCGVTVFLPVLSSDYVIDHDIIITAIQRFIFVILLMLPFEIRDLNFDSLKLSTIPQKIGVKNTKVIGAVMAVFIFLLEFFKDKTSENQILILGIVQVLTFLFVLLAKKNQNKYYSSFWVESIPLFWLILFLMLG